MGKRRWEDHLSPQNKALGPKRPGRLNVSFVHLPDAGGGANHNHHGHVGEDHEHPPLESQAGVHPDDRNQHGDRQGIGGIHQRVQGVFRPGKQGDGKAQDDSDNERKHQTYGNRCQGSQRAHQKVTLNQSLPECLEHHRRRGSCEVRQVTAVKFPANQQGRQ